MRASRTWNWQLSLALQEGGVGLDELVRLDIANRDSSHGCGVGACRWVRIGGELVDVLLLSNIASRKREVELFVGYLHVPIGKT